MLLYGVLWGGDKERSNGEISGQFSGLQAHLTINPNSNTFYLSAAASSSGWVLLLGMGTVPRYTLYLLSKYINNVDF